MATQRKSRLLFLAFLVVYFPVHCQSIYQATSYGFLTTFNRSEPLVLLRTLSGLQMLVGNGSCYNNLTSMYYPSEVAIKYVGYSSMDNYLAVVSIKDQICFRNLYKSDWNNGLKRDLKRECRSSNINTLKNYDLSINMHVMLALDSSGSVNVVTLEQPMCSIPITLDPISGATMIHVTNFIKHDDLVLVGTSKGKVRMFTLTGQEQENNQTLPKTDTLRAIGSHEDQGGIYFFLAIDRASEAVVLQYNTTLSDSSQVVFQIVGSHVVSLSISGGIMALLLREKQSLKSHWLHLHSLTPAKTHEAVYQCNASLDLVEAILVNRREQRIRNFCSINFKACQTLGTGQMCDYTKIFNFEPQLRLDEVKIETELHHKIALAIALAIVCPLVLGLFQICQLHR